MEHQEPGIDPELRRSSKARVLVYGGGFLILMIALGLTVGVGGRSGNPAGTTTTTSAVAVGSSTTSTTGDQTPPTAASAVTSNGNHPAAGAMESDPAAEQPTTTTRRATTSEDSVTLTDQLAVQPVDGGVYLLGNSMFKTGVDVDSMQAGIPERDVRFNYYDGHYTSLWYLIAEGALGPSEQRPEIVVWGFRPRYAAVPAFRQNRPNSTELFEFDDLAYNRLTSRSAVSGDFVTGPTVEFADGFIPLTAESFDDSGLAQLVVIWRPVTVAQGTPDPAEQQFVADAIAYFEANDFPYVDFFNDDQLDLAMFASGDHYNAEGRAYITDYLTGVIEELLAVI